ncbi:MAG: D-tyrosyl-tRNA(Tyr) deacylase [Bacilli bacterium]|jgi:D-tyrosyl-tRNA(Tyr) deacylase|nr:D-tyrosyl-tRNA(Tyr) deacylase [Bacilli bacterium]
MKVIVQKVLSASCTVDNKITGKINQGYMLLVGFTHSDTIENVLKMAKKIVGLRIFEDENGKMNLDIKSVNGEILSISQFTLYGDCNKGNRPSFVNSMRPEFAEELYLKFNDVLRKEYDMKVETGIFGAHMILDPICDGPVTIELEF